MDREGHSESMAVELKYIPCKLHNYYNICPNTDALQTSTHASVVGVFSCVHTPGVTHDNVMCSEFIRITSKPYQLGGVCMYILNYTNVNVQIIY